MNKIDKLIDELCPNGVEFKELGEVTAWDKKFNGVSKEKQKKILSFKHISAKDLKNLKVKNGNIKLLATGKFVGYTTEELAKAYINEGEVISIPSGGSANIKYFKGKFVDSGNILESSFDNKLYNLKYIYYFILSKNDLIESNFRGGGVKHPKMGDILKIKIPIPPLQIQEEIVKILDNFTELEAELEARKKQYEHYRDELLTFGDDEVEFKALGEVLEPTSNIRWQNNENKQFQYIDLSSVDRDKNLIIETKVITKETAPSRAQKIVKTGDIIFGTTRPTLKRFCIINDNYNKQICSTGFCVLRPKTNLVLTNYIFYIISSIDFYNYTEQNQKGASYPAISDNIIKKFKIPIPSIEEQERIVTILDKFDALVNDISIGLPAELKARRQQYEYYREKLLTFKEVNK